MPAPGDTLSRYRLIEQIGEGGMGEVWRARDTRLDRDVALKILPEEATREPERLDRFVTEAKAVAALNHPNIVTIHSVEQAEGVHFLVMELLRGKPLSDMIPAGGFDVQRLLDLSIPIVDAVRSAHEQGITHRDIKPANVMVDDQDRVKILDFGLAQFREGDRRDNLSDVPTRTLTTRSEIRGTLPYMSPEQIQDKPLDHRTDVFSLGALLYEMATGQRPFAGDSGVELIAAILRDYPRPVTELNPSQPMQLQRIIAHSLQKDRARRLQTTLDLRNQLEALKQEIETSPVPRESTRAALSGVRLASVAVLPLDDHSADPAQEFFADGMTEALITGLAKIEGLKVISRTSVMRYKGSDKGLGQIARELGVGAIVEGSVMRVGDRVRITAQLIDATTDEHLWAESYEREIRDLFALQAEVAQAVAAQVRVKLTPQDKLRLGAGRAVNPAAHDACLRGRHFWYQRTPDAVAKGLEFFQKALELDPGHAPAHAGVADSYLVDGGGYLGVPSKEAYRRARAAALKAIELDPGLAEAHTSLAGVLSDYDWDWDAGEAAYLRALDLNPNYSTARYWYADHLVRVGRFDEAIREVRLALETDPLSSICSLMVAWVQYFSRRYDASVEQARRTLELDPRYPLAYRCMGWALDELGRYEEAIDAHTEATRLSGGSVNFRAQLARSSALAGRQDEARQILDELVELSRTTRLVSHDVAVIQAALGDPTSALEWLTRACDEHDDHVPYLKVDPRLDALRHEQRFTELLERVGLHG